MCAFWCTNTRYCAHGLCVNQNCVIWMDDICGDMPGELPFSMHHISRSLRILPVTTRQFLCLCTCFSELYIYGDTPVLLRTFI